MLQRIRDGIGRWVFGLILGLIAISFVFWGIDFDLTGATFAAKVNGKEISLAEFDRDLQLEQNQFQEMYRVELTEDLRRQLRRSVVDRLVQREVLLQRVEKAGYRVSDERLAEFIRSAAAFQVGGEFSMDVYANQLAVQGLSPRAFEEMQREQLALLDLQVGVADSTFLTPSEYRRFVELANQQREVAYALFEVESFVPQVEIDDDAVASFYEDNRDRFVTEEAAAIEYVELRRADIAEQIEVTDQELEGYYARLRDNFRTEEERRARHILIVSADGETPAETEARAAEIAERIRGGEEFAALAAELSEDPGTAAQGGDLGWIAPGMLAGPFEDALFAMESGELSGPVQTNFGFHIIRLDDVRAGEEQTLAEVRDQLLEDYRTERADDIFYELANQLADSAFDAYDELAPVATQLQLQLKTLERFSRRGDSAAFPNSAAIVDALYGAGQLEIGVNSALIELSDEHAAVVRITERFPPEPQPLEEVAAEIRETLTRETAEALAAEAAEAFRAAMPADLTTAFVGTVEGGALDQGAAAGAEAGASGAAAAGAEQQGPEASADVVSSADDGAAEPAPEAAIVDGDGDGDLSVPAAALAAVHGGRWNSPAWVGRSSSGVPTVLLATAFELEAPAPGGLVSEPVELTTGDRAILFLSGVQAGRAEAISRDDRERLRQQLINQIGTAELGSYAGTVGAAADVRVPDEILQPQF